MKNGIFAVMNKNLLPIHSLLFKDIQMLLTDKHMLVSSGGIDTYYSPFVRVEHGEIRRKTYAI